MYNHHGPTPAIKPSLDIQTPPEKIIGPQNLPKTPNLRRYLDV